MSRYGESLAESEALQDKANWEIAFRRADENHDYHKAMDLLYTAIELDYELPTKVNDTFIQSVLNQLHAIQDSSQK